MGSKGTGMKLPGDARAGSRIMHAPFFERREDFKGIVFTETKLNTRCHKQKKQFVTSARDALETLTAVL